MESLDQGHLHYLLQNPETNMSRPGIEPGSQASTLAKNYSNSLCCCYSDSLQYCLYPKVSFHPSFLPSPQTPRRSALGKLLAPPHKKVYHQQIFQFSVKKSVNAHSTSAPWCKKGSNYLSAIFPLLHKATSWYIMNLPMCPASTNCGASFAIIIFSSPRANFAKKTVEYRVCRCFCSLKFVREKNN